VACQINCLVLYFVHCWKVKWLICQKRWGRSRTNMYRWFCIEVAEFDLIWEIRPIRLDSNLIQLDFLRKSNWPDSIWTRPDLRSNDLQSNRNLSTIWKNTTYKLTRPDSTRPYFFQKIKLIRPEPEPNPTQLAGLQPLILSHEKYLTFYTV
jgi:hypothetical protein